MLNFFFFHVFDIHYTVVYLSLLPWLGWCSLDNIFVHLCCCCFRVWQNQNNNSFRPNGRRASFFSAPNYEPKREIFTTMMIETECVCAFLVDVWCCCSYSKWTRHHVHTHTHRNIHTIQLVQPFPIQTNAHIHNNLLHAAGAFKNMKFWEKLFLTTDTQWSQAENAEKRKKWRTKQFVFISLAHAKLLMFSTAHAVQTENLIFTILWSCRTGPPACVQKFIQNKM